MSCLQVAPPISEAEVSATTSSDDVDGGSPVEISRGLLISVSVKSARATETAHSVSVVGVNSFVTGRDSIAVIETTSTVPCQESLLVPKQLKSG